MSLFDNADETIAFCNALNQALRLRQRTVRIDLSKVTRASSDALLLMRAVIDENHGIYRKVGGNLPDDPQVAAKVKESGFFEGFTRPPKELPPAQGLMRRKRHFQVQSDIAAELVEFAQQNANVSPEVAAASYKWLVEMMLNTLNHSGEPSRNGSKAKPGHRWIASAYCEDAVAHFTFVDLGVGVLGSTAPRTFLEQMGVTLRIFGERKLLAQVFKGKIGASVNKPGRGFGLPTMRAAALAGHLPDLRVLTSRVIGKVAELRFASNQERLHGTVYRWVTSQPREQS